MKSIENLVKILKLGHETFERKRLALVLKISTNTSLGIASNINLPFLVAAVLRNGKEQFLCPVVGENKPRLQDIMCDLSYTSYKNKILRAGIVGSPPYFIIQEQKTDGVDVKFLKFLTEKKNLQLNIIIPKTDALSLDMVCMKKSSFKPFFPKYTMIYHTKNILF